MKPDTDASEMYCMWRLHIMLRASRVPFVRAMAVTINPVSFVEYSNQNICVVCILLSSCIMTDGVFSVAYVFGFCCFVVTTVFVWGYTHAHTYTHPSQQLQSIIVSWSFSVIEKRRERNYHQWTPKNNNKQNGTKPSISKSSNRKYGTYLITDWETG